MCHETQRIVEGRRFRAQWVEVIDAMVARGATVNDEDFEIVLAYLVSEHGRVNVNVADAAEIAQVLHLDTTAAETIVAHRTEKGKFADFAALVAVPGVPVESLRKRRSAIVF